MFKNSFRNKITNRFIRSLTNSVTKFNFARKVNKDQNNKIFAKFSIEEDKADIKQNKENTHFKKVLKREMPYENFNTKEERRLNRVIQEKVQQGHSVKKVLRDVMKDKMDPDSDKNNLPQFDDKFNFQENDEFLKNNIEQFLLNDVEMINKRKNEEERKEYSIDPKSVEEHMSDEFRNQLYNQEDLQNLKNLQMQKLKKSKSKGKVEEKDLKEMHRYKIKETEEDLGENAAESFKEKMYTQGENLDEDNDEEDPQFKKMKKAFKKSFNKNGSKRITKNEDADQDSDELFNMRNLRKIKNITNPEYSKELSSSTDLVDTIPDIDLVTKREQTSNLESNLKDLIERDLHPYDAKMKKKDAVIQDALKLSKINTLNIVNVRKNRNEIFKKRALDLAKVWQMDARETKHWYYRLRREEKIIFKAILMKKKLEQKRKLKKIAKQWKVENEENIEINYLQMLREESGDQKANLEPEKLQIPKHYKNVNEFLFFGEDTEFFRHYKRTCKNILNCLNKFFESNKMGVKRGIGRNVDIVVSEVKMNKSCTVVYAWWDLPLINSPLMDMSEEVNDTLYKNVELNLNQAVPYIKGIVTREVGLKYAPEIRFVKDAIEEEMSTFEKEVTELIDEDKRLEIHKKREKELKVVRLLDRKDIIENIKKMIDNIKNEEMKGVLTSVFFGEHSNQGSIQNYVDKEQFTAPISYRIASLEGTNPKLYQGILDLIKNSFGVDHNNVDEFYSQSKELQAYEKKLNKAEERHKRKKEKIFKKLNIKEEDLSKTKNINFNDSVNNFLNQYDRKIPGQYTISPSLKELNEKKNKADFIDEIVQRRVKNQIKNEVKASEKIGKSRDSRRNKAAEFWNKLNNQLL